MLWKADIDAARRRIPVKPDDRELLHVAVLHEGVVMVARRSATCVIDHWAPPFVSAHRHVCVWAALHCSREGHSGKVT